MEIRNNFTSKEIIPIPLEINTISEMLVVDTVAIHQKVNIFIATFIKSLNLEENKEGALHWKESRMFTCQTRSSLNDSLFKTFTMLREYDNIAIRLKDGTSAKMTGRKYGGRTYYVITTRDGTPKHILKKCELMGEGLHRKTCKVEVCLINNFQIVSREVKEFCAFKYVKSLTKAHEYAKAERQEKFRNQQLRHEARLLNCFDTYKLEAIQSPYKFLGFYLRGVKHRTIKSVSATLFVQGELYQRCLLSDHKTLFDTWTMEQLLSAFVKLAESLRISHQLGIYHGDLKTDNLLNKDHKLYMTDFGGAWVMEHYAERKSIMPSRSTRTLGYGLNKDHIMLEKIKDLFHAAGWRGKMDIFSFAISMYEMFSPIHLYNSKLPLEFENENFESRKERIMKNLSKKIKVPHPLKTLTNLFAAMLHPEALERPALHEVIETLKNLLIYCEKYNSTNEISFNEDISDISYESVEDGDHDNKKIGMKSDQCKTKKKNKNCVIF